MYTSYFRQIDNIKNPLSICGKAPHWYVGPEFKRLAPKYWFFEKYKKGEFNEEQYTYHFKKDVLEPLNCQRLYTYLVNMYGDDVTLLCYEKPGDFCHRHIVSEWFETNLNITVNEKLF